ncbi:helix-turn-helix domain-containing protein [Aquimarina longa]|uniref:helix-turn-helix domain-containing protein n=1 Tax=Aquimarina longa TaxID=1080221 RepID=UPI000782197F|nr:helix-turn-helix domain-containing protein [Aquimarina longa]
MEVICLETEAFYALVDEVVDRLKEKNQGHTQDKWISESEAMRLLRVTSKTTISNLRNNGDIRFSQPRRKLILYDRDSINEYLEKHSKNTF